MKLPKLTVGLAIGLVSVGALAMSSGSIVFDPTNFAKNAITAGSVVKTEITSAATALQTLRQYQEMLRQARAAATGDLHAITALAGDPSLTRALNDAQGTYSALKTLDTNLDNMAARYDYLAGMSKRYGITEDQYIKNRALLAKDGVQRAQIEQRKDLEAIENVKKGLTAVKSLQGKEHTETAALLMKLDQQGALTNTILVQDWESRVYERMAEREKKAQAEAAAGQAQADSKYALSDRTKMVSDYNQALDQALDNLANSAPKRK